MGLALEEGWFERMLEAHGTTAWHFTICRLEDERPIGTIALTDVDLVNGSAGLGIAIGEDGQRGRGFGTDAIAALVRFGFEQLRLHRIWLEVYAFNDRALRAYERCGFVLEGTLRQAVFRHGRFHDVHLMAILREPWAEDG